MKTIVLTGGGTAGHVMPALALIPELRKYFENIYYMGEKGGIEEKLAIEHGIVFFGTTAVKFKRGVIWDNFKIPKLLTDGIKEAESILKRISPDVVFAKGGYASLPTAFACRKLKIPLVIHESDMSLGLANKVCLPFAKKVLTTYENTYKKGVCTGNPIRNEIFTGVPKKIYFDEKKPIILVMGGSKGSLKINEMIKEYIKDLSDYNIIHIVGNSPVDIKAKNYYSTKFANDIQNYYASADIVITRAGANALSELIALGKRVIAIPLPKGASRGDQIQNAYYYKDKGLIELMEEENITLPALTQMIERLLKSPPRSTVKNDTNKRIVEEIKKTL